MRRPLLEISCCVDVSDTFLQKARFALEMLLLPLGLRPVWTAAEASPDAQLYYGSAPSGLPRETVILPMSAEAEPFFEAKCPHNPEQVRWIEWDRDRWPVLFSAGDEPDLVASTFFWLSGWQEYVVPERDQHGRFPFHASLQYQLGTASVPVVDAYRRLLAEALEESGIHAPASLWGGRSWVYCPTVDVDHLMKWHIARLVHEASAATRLPWIRTGDHTSPILTGLRERLSGHDPFESALGRIIDEISGRGGTATIFLKADAYGPHDAHYSLTSAALTKYVDELNHFGFEIGLHPGYHAHTHRGRMEAERHRVEQAAGKPVNSVRQHYLRYEPDLTSLVQAEAGFRIDSSLGFADHEGFRNGTCLPFRIYDLVEDRPLPVWEMPVAAMDAALFNRRGLGPEEAHAAVQELMAMVRRFDGVLVMIWHNQLWDERDHPGWGAVFGQVLEDAVRGGALVSSLEGALARWGTDAEK